MKARGLPIIVFVLALLTSFGCGGSGGGGNGSGTNPPALACRDAGPAGVDTVTMTCGGAIDSTTEQIDVVIGGPASGVTALRGINFDVTYDPAKLEFVTASATSPLFDPSALVLSVLANGQQGRVVAAIQQVGTQPDVIVTPGQHLVLGLTFRRVAAASFGPTPLTFERAEATAATAAISFTNGLTLEYP